MKIFFYSFLFLSSFTLVSAQKNNAEWIPLFDGNTTQGWKPLAQVEKFEAIDEELRLSSKVNVWVVSDLEMQDFEVECEVKIPLDYEKFNSGLGFRLTGDRGKPKGYQCEIDRERPAAVYGIGLGGWIYPKKETQTQFSQRIMGLFETSSWNHFRVRAIGSKVTTFLNGKLVAETKDLIETQGRFGIQHHGKGGTVCFRKLRARSL